jgi:hypothetical protein
VTSPYAAAIVNAVVGSRPANPREYRAKIVHRLRRVISAFHSRVGTRSSHRTLRQVSGNGTATFSVVDRDLPIWGNRGDIFIECNGAAQYRGGVSQADVRILQVRSHLGARCDDIAPMGGGSPPVRRVRSTPPRGPYADASWQPNTPRTPSTIVIQGSCVSRCVSIDMFR